MHTYHTCITIYVLHADSTSIRNKATARFEIELQLYCYSYRIAGNFQREFIFGYFKEAFLFENEFLVTAFLRKLIPTTKLTASP